MNPDKTAKRKRLFRYISFCIYTSILLWTYKLLRGVRPLLETYGYTSNYIWAFLTAWAFVVCFLYSLLSLKWHNKWVDCLGEIGFSAQIMICPFFFIVIFPFILTLDLPLEIKLYSIVLHIIIPLLIVLESIVNNLNFAAAHRKYLLIFAGVYFINNLYWTLIKKVPVYPGIDWVTVKSYILGLIALGMFMGAHKLGRRLYFWKEDVYLNITPVPLNFGTPQLNVRNCTLFGPAPI